MDKLKELFEKAKIKYIISVDDCHAANATPTPFAIKEHMAKNRDIAKKFFAAIGQEVYAETLDGLPDEDLADYLESVCDELGQINLGLYCTQYMKDTASLEKTELLSFLEKLKSENCIEEYKLFASHEDAQKFFDHLSEHLEISQDKKALWMIDKDLQNSGGTSDSGISLIKNFIEAHVSFNIYALTSAQLGGLTDQMFRDSIADQLPTYDSLLACIVDKHNITEKNYPQLYNEMAGGFRQNYSGAILRELISIYKSASEKANATINAFGNDTIYRVFFESGKAEGVSPIEVFQRLLLIIIKNDIAFNISEKYNDIAKLIYDYSQLCEWCGIIKKDLSDFDVIKKARISECYDSCVSQRYLPVSCGDIFKVGEVPYILLGQACNLTIRATGERTAQCATLAKIQKCDNPKQYPISKYQLKYYQEDSIYEIDFNQTINIDFNILDLCTLNRSGETKLPPNFDISKFQYRYPQSIYKKLVTVVESNQKLIEKYDKLSQAFSQQALTINDFCEGFREIYKDNSLEIKLSFDDGITYNLQRESRLAEMFMDDILKRYSDYHSRKALDYDFAGDYKIIPFKVKYDLDWDSFGLREEEAVASLLPDFKYYQNTAFDKEEEKKRAIVASFESEYTGNILPDSKSVKVKKGELVKKCDLKDLVFTVNPKYIPVNINGTEYCDVLRDICTYRIPLGTIQGLKVRQNQKFSMENGASMSISNERITFTFPKDVEHTFFYAAALDQKVSFSLVASPKLTLTIAYE